MKIITPITLDAGNTTTTVPETDHPEWSGVTTYAAEESVQITDEHETWSSVADGNTGNNPKTTDDRMSDTPKWRYLGKTNAWKMFDEFINTQTENQDEIIVEIEPGEVTDGINLFYVDAQIVIITGNDPVEGEVYSSEYDMLDYEVDDFYEYFYQPVRVIRTLVDLQFPPYPDAVITVNIQNPGGTAKCGAVVLGLQCDIGQTRWAPKLGRISFSKKERDIFGRMYLNKGESARRIELDLLIPSRNVDTVDYELSRIDGVGAAFIGDDVDAGFNSMNIYGFCRDFSMVIPGPEVSECVIEIESFI